MLRARAFGPWWVLALCGSGLLACREAPTEKAVDKAQPATVAPAKTPAAHENPAPQAERAPAPAILESDARALVDRWVAAQNAGDFAGYEALYAERFEGIKRGGTRTYRFNRKGWVADRKRMFAAPMTVEIAELSVAIGARSAIARFEQTWSSKSFRDHGPKLLVLVPKGGALQIASEQMLASQVAAQAAQAWALPDFMQVVHARHHYVVLAENAEARGPALLDSGKGVEKSARKAADTALLPQPARDLLGSTVIAYGPSGVVCRGKIGTPFVLRRVVPPYDDESDPDADARKPSPAQRAQAIWDEAAELTLLVAELSETDTDCSAALWARAADRPEPAVFAREATPPDLVPRVEAQVRTLPHYLEMDREYHRRRVDGFIGKDSSPHWENFEGAAPQLWSWRHGDRQLVSYDVSVGACSEFGGGLWALFEVRGDKLVLLAQRGSGGVPDDFTFIGIADIDLDGQPDAVGGSWKNANGEADAVTRGAREGLQLVHDISPPFHACGC